MKRNPRKVKWTKAYRHLHGKDMTQVGDHSVVSDTPSVSFYLSLDSVILHYPATNKKKRREYHVIAGDHISCMTDML
jgi:hypothetical protein